MSTSPYRGRLAPSPTGFLHLGHARTFWIARQRAAAAGGKLILRVEDLDAARCKPEFTAALYEDLRWFGLRWDEGPDVGGGHGDCGPYLQSQRRAWHLAVLEKLRVGGFIYPCRCSRREVRASAGAPHLGEEEPVYPGTCRPAKTGTVFPPDAAGMHWRFRVPDDERLSYADGALGMQSAVAGIDFGDFVVWRGDGVPAYQLAVVADDAAMGVTEVVRGEDLRLSTFRQLLLYRALGWPAPRFFHAPLVTDPETGLRLAKRHAALSLRRLRAEGADPGELRRGW